MNTLHDPPATASVIRCVRCWNPVTDADDLVRTPFAATGQPSVAHRVCPEDVQAMSRLERVLARLSLQLVTRIERFWQPCPRCHTVRWPWHQHRGGVVLSLAARQGTEVDRGA